ncbi:MAG: NAD(P)H-dependent oxidoreductase [Sphingomonadaceae bacterium]|nr:NAD(P)H-dependent oxidoreductase [Sphingomonadaceae bacterium]
MVERVTLIIGHPDPDRSRFGHALAAAYAEGARAARRHVRVITVADLDFPLLRSQHDWLEGTPPPAIARAQADIEWADHIAIFYPLWLGDVPALLKGFLEQALRPGFALRYRDGGLPEKLLAGRSADVIVTMGMPSFVYGAWFGAHSLRSLKRNVLAFVGIAPVRSTIIGSVEASSKARARWLSRMQDLGGRDHG